ncbi:MAG TPA: FAD-binding oxidoreductase [Actinomycetota bacterium]|nr:FAD-binding oxidoreductase [Actinomycetota bacterium]
MPVEILSKYAEVAEALRAAAAEGRTVRVCGGGTKLSWGRPPLSEGITLSTRGLDEIVEHNAGDLTAVVQAGVRLADAQTAFAEAGQMLAVDPALGAGDGATVGGVVATADSGPLRHRYGGVRDQVIGIRGVLADGSVIRSGGKVIKNVAGYDLGKLFTGSFGTLGVIVEVSVRLHPLPGPVLTVAGRTDNAQVLQQAAISLSGSAISAISLDFRWTRGEGSLLARFGGEAGRNQAQVAEQMMEAAGLEASLEENDESLWAHQRAAQRAPDGVVAKVSALPTDLARVVRAADSIGAAAVGRAGLGLAWLRLEQPGPAEAAASVEDLRSRLAPRPVVVLDAPAEIREKIDVWGSQPESLLALTRRVKDRFDPSGVCNRGIFVGGI